MKTLKIQKTKRTKRTFWDDPAIGAKLDTIPDREMSVIIRMALRAWFGLKNTKPTVQEVDCHEET